VAMVPDVLKPDRVTFTNESLAKVSQTRESSIEREVFIGDKVRIASRVDGFECHQALAAPHFC